MALPSQAAFDVTQRVLRNLLESMVQRPARGFPWVEGTRIQCKGLCTT